MQTSEPPYAIPQAVDADLARVLAYWKGLIRGDNEIPFWDDVNLSALPDLLPRLMLLEAFERPTRFRFALVGPDIRARYGDDLNGKFVDEIEIRDPLPYLASQSSATLECRGPTFYRGVGARGAAREYSRLLLPMWGDGRVGMLLVAFAWR